MPIAPIRWLLATWLPAAAALTQSWAETCGRSPSGAVALHQAALDVGADAHVLLVASHPDDRYVLPAVWLRSTFGFRVSVLLATRGGGGQNSLGPETGDALDRLRTLEAEAGCARYQCSVWYLNRPDAGYRRSAAETFAEWGRPSTLRELVRLLRLVRPDAVLTTHHREETHGHDLALVELLPEAIRAAADPGFETDGAAHQVGTFLLGSGSSPSSRALRIDADRLDLDRGATWRRLAHDVLRQAHVTPGEPAAIDAVFDAELRFEPQFPDVVPLDGPRPLGLPSVFDVEIWQGDAERAASLEQRLGPSLREQIWRRSIDTGSLASLLAELRNVRAVATSDQVRLRLARRIEALERLLLLAAGVQIELETAPGTMAIAGEEFQIGLHLHAVGGVPPRIRAEGIDGVEVELDELEPPGRHCSTSRGVLGIRIPLEQHGERDPMARRFRADRFVPPVRIRFFVTLGEVEVSTELTVPIELRSPVELAVVPHMLLLPTSRRRAQFSVAVQRNSSFPVEGDVEVRGPAGYAIPTDRQHVLLTERRSDMLAFAIEAAPDRDPGVDVLRIRLGGTRVELPVHTVAVQVPSDLRIGILRSRDDTLPNLLGVGGFGVGWTELSDADIAAGDLRAFDTVIVDIRALRDRPAARRGFRRLLDFATGKGRRLLVFYQKDTEFHPSGEGFVGAPFTPFVLGRGRVTRADAPVRVLRPDHLLLQHPNVVQPADWDAWEQERALYLPSLYGSQYEELLEIHDPGQPPERGGLLYARCGDGEFVYCGLALWRQLKKLHPGAVRLFANLVTPLGR